MGMLRCAWAEGSSSAREGIIGQFGVGFYSTFMVGNKIKVGEYLVVRVCI